MNSECNDRIALEKLSLEKTEKLGKCIETFSITMKFTFFSSMDNSLSVDNEIVICFEIGWNYVDLFRFG